MALDRNAVEVSNKVHHWYAGRLLHCRGSCHSTRRGSGPSCQRHDRQQFHWSDRNCHQDPHALDRNIMERSNKVHCWFAVGLLIEDVICFCSLEPARLFTLVSGEVTLDRWLPNEHRELIPIRGPRRTACPDFQFWSDFEDFVNMHVVESLYKSDARVGLIPGVKYILRSRARRGREG